MKKSGFGVMVARPLSRRVHLSCKGKPPRRGSGSIPEGHSSTRIAQGERLGCKESWDAKYANPRRPKVSPPVDVQCVVRTHCPRTGQGGSTPPTGSSFAVLVVLLFLSGCLVPIPRKPVDIGLREQHDAIFRALERGTTVEEEMNWCYIGEPSGEGTRL